jgi:hypothetical protein
MGTSQFVDKLHRCDGELGALIRLRLTCGICTNSRYLVS